MKRVLAVLAAMALLCVTAFCVFGFLSAFELGRVNSWHFLYGACGVGSLIIGGRLLVRSSRARKVAILPIAALGLFSLAVLLLWLWAVLAGGG